MSFGNKGGGCRKGAQYPSSITIHMTDEMCTWLYRHARKHFTTVPSLVRGWIEEERNDDRAINPLPQRPSVHREDDGLEAMGQDACTGVQGLQGEAVAGIFSEEPESTGC